MEPKSNVKSVAADQIKRACQNYWGGGQAPQAPPHAKALNYCLLYSFVQHFQLSHSTHISTVKPLGGPSGH